MSTRRTDAASAGLVAVVVWAIGRAWGLAPADLRRPVPLLAGVGGAVALEAAFARWPERATRLWRRPVVRFGSPVALVAGVLAAAGRSAPRRSDETPPAAPFAAALGGVTGYFALLVGIVAGVVPEPATWFGGRRPSAFGGRDAREGGRE